MTRKKDSKKKGAVSISGAPEPITPLTDDGDEEIDIFSQAHNPIDLETVRPDWDYWLKFESWTVEQAAALLHAIEPEALKSNHLYSFPGSVFNSWQDTLSFLVDSIEHHNLKHYVGTEWITGIPSHLQSYPVYLLKVCPKDLIDWSKSKGIEVPKEIESAFPVGETEPMQLRKKPEQQKIDFNRYPGEKLKEEIEDIGSGMWQGKKRKDIRRSAVEKIVEVAKSRYKDFDPNNVPGETQDLIDLIELLTPRILNKHDPKRSISQSDPVKITKKTLRADIKSPPVLIAFPQGKSKGTGFTLRQIFADIFDE